MTTQHDAANELLPCPFCGENVLEYASEDEFYIGCGHCEYSLRETFVPLTHKAGAIAAWNTRALPATPAPSDEVARLREENERGFRAGYRACVDEKVQGGYFAPRHLAFENQAWEIHQAALGPEVGEG